MGLEKGKAHLCKGGPDVVSRKGLFEGKQAGEEVWKS